MKNEKEINTLNAMLNIYYSHQTQRIAIDGQLAIKKDVSPKKNAFNIDTTWLLASFKLREEYLKAEKEMEKCIEKYLNENFPIWKVFFEPICGCGPLMAAVCITEIDIEKAVAVSNLWSYAGIASSEGFGYAYDKKKKEWVKTDKLIPKDRLTKDFRAPFNTFLKSKLMGVLASSFIVQRSSYRKYYDDKRRQYEAKDWGKESQNPTNPQNPKAGHQHNAARRYMIKMFLKDLYVAWRTLEGLSVRKPYEEEYLGHVHHTEQVAV